MTRLPNKILMWSANLLVPGAGLVLMGRLGAGIAGAILWLSAAAYLVLGVIWSEAGWIQWVSRGGAVGIVYAAAQGVLYAVSRRMERHLADEPRDGRFKAALAAYLTGSLDESESICRALLKDDPDDVEATLQLGYLARQRGDLAAARRWFARARYLDDEGKWDFQVERELAACNPQTPCGKAKPG